jgi:phosphotriesterase-related protein
MFEWTRGEARASRMPPVAQVETTAGPVDAGELGVTLIHEHLRVRSEAVAAAFPRLYDEARERERALDWVGQAVQRGVKTICDPSVMEHDRDVRFQAEIARETGVQLVVATGIYTYHYLPEHFRNREIEYMVEQFVRDIEEGIQGTDVKAAFIKCCTDQQGVTEDVEKVLRAAARASKQTGRPIMTHSHPASGAGIAQMGIFLEEEVDPARVLIGHTGDVDSIHYIETLLAMGPFIGMDRYGLDILLPTERRNWTVAELCDRGYADRMFLSQDACCTIDWYPPELVEQMAPNWHMTYVLDEVVPALKEAGVTDEQVKTMMQDNPPRWLAGG